MPTVRIETLGREYNNSELDEEIDTIAFEVDETHDEFRFT